MVLQNNILFYNNLKFLESKTSYLFCKSENELKPMFVNTEMILIRL